MRTCQRARRSRSLCLALCVACTITADAAANSVYKWIDEAGNTHYGDTPPPNATKQKMHLRKTPAVDPSVNTRRDRTERLLNSFAAERADKKAERAALAAAKKTRADNCAKARATQQKYENSAFIYTKNAQGERTILDDDGHAKVIAGARADVEKWCD